MLCLAVLYSYSLVSKFKINPVITIFVNQWVQNVNVSENWDPSINCFILFYYLKKNGSKRNQIMDTWLHKIWWFFLGC